MAFVVSAATALVAAFAIAPAADAITNGEPDGPTHTNVGAILVDWQNRGDGVLDQRCSGTLISPTVLLTAGHCIKYFRAQGFTPSDVKVSFDTDIYPLTAASELYDVIGWASHPDYTRRLSGENDLAVLLLSQAPAVTPAYLPRAGLLDDLNAARTLRDELFTVVGYGRNSPSTGDPKALSLSGERSRAVSSFHALTDPWLYLSQNAARGDGGTCYGDSGGPNFLGTGQSTSPGTIAAITVSGDRWCRALDTVLRLDTEDARRFLGTYVPLS